MDILFGCGTWVVGHLTYYVLTYFYYFLVPSIACLWCHVKFCKVSHCFVVSNILSVTVPRFRGGVPRKSLIYKFCSNVPTVPRFLVLWGREEKNDLGFLRFGNFLLKNPLGLLFRWNKWVFFFIY